MIEDGKFKICSTGKKYNFKRPYQTTNMVHEPATLGIFSEMQTIPDLLHRNLHFNKTPQVIYVHTEV